MFYVFFIALALALFFIFNLLTKEYRSWTLIKARWFRSGIDNGLLFSAQVVDRHETIRLTGEYKNCTATLSLIKSPRPRSLIRVRYPQQLEEGLRSYPGILVERMAGLLGGRESEEEFNRYTTEEEGFEKILHKRLNPRVIEQLIALRQFGPRGRFEITENWINFEQEGLLFDPAPFFPVLEEMVITVNLLADNIDHLFVR